MAILAIFSIESCDSQQGEELSSSLLKISQDSLMHTKIQLEVEGQEDFIQPGVPPEVVFAYGKAYDSFSVDESRPFAISEIFGSGEALMHSGHVNLEGDGQLLKKTILKVFDDYPGLIVSQTTLRNSGKKPVTIDSTYTQQYLLKASAKTDSTKFWSFQGASYDTRPDWILPLKSGFFRYNFQGMNAPDYGGGIPVLDLWTPEIGIAVGHLETSPRQLALPVKMDGNTAGIHIVDPVSRNIQPGDSLVGPTTFAYFHDNDFYTALKTYANLMGKQGITMPAFTEPNYAPVWCAWGYGRNFDTKAVLGTIPKVKELGLKWVVLDDGWQVAEGDWSPFRERFPNGDADMKAFVKSVHHQNLLARLWWVPFTADPGTAIAKDHPDWFILDKNGNRQMVSWWDSWYLCPAVPEVRAYTAQLVNKFIKEWGYDGLKIDGQHLNSVIPCYNPAHHHSHPEESVKAVPEFFKAIHSLATEIKPNAVVEICPCGDAASFFNMAATTQPVASDPTSSWQIRTKGKTFKALMGSQVPYAGDHVELSDGGNDFASTLGIGGVVSTKFTWAPAAALASAAWAKEDEPGKYILDGQKEAHWKKWVGLYEQLHLARGEYLGSLYDIGFDRPEAHAISKGDTLYYAFFADRWSGLIELRGLKKINYTVIDYINGRQLGTFEGPVARLEASFDKFLLVKALPE